MKSLDVYVRDGIYTTLVFAVAFAVNLLIQEQMGIWSLVPMIFVLGIFLISLKRVCRELRLYISLLRLRFHSAGELFFRRRDAHGGHRHKHPDHQNQGAGENAGRERDGENAGQPAAGHLP